MFPQSYPESIALVLHQQRAKDLIEAADRHRLVASAVKAAGGTRRTQWVKLRWVALRRLVSAAEPAVLEPVVTISPSTVDSWC
jgi:hypothetical protein